MARKNGEKTRELILKAAAQVFYNVNYHEAGLRDIAKLSGISPRCIYKYFHNKEQLLVALNNEGLKLMMTEMEQQLAGVMGTTGKIGKMTYFYLDYFQRNYTAAWQVYVTTNLNMWHKSKEAWQNLAATEAVLNQILAEGQRTGEIKEDIDVNAIRILYFGGIRFAIQSWLATERGWDLVSVADGLTNTILEAIKKRPDQAVPGSCPFMKNSDRAFKLETVV
jgi:TetR/AcrR family transcriptional regulator, fatty acid metabolism regulator protein